MKLRTIAYSLIIILIIGLFIAWATYNRHSLTIDFFFGEITASVWIIMLITFLSGFLICLIWMLVRNSQLKIKQWQERKEQKKKQEAEKFYHNGVDLLLKGDKEKALEKFSQALQLNSQYSDAYIKAGNILREQGRYEEAIQLHWSARQMAGSNPETVISLAEDYRAMENYPKGEEILREAIELKIGDELSFLRKLREFLFVQQKWDEAEKLQLRIIKLVRQSSEKEDEEQLLKGISYQLGLNELQKEKKKEAISIFRHLIKAKPDFCPAYESLGQIYLEQGKANKAVEAWQEGFQNGGCHFLLQKIEEFYLSGENPKGAIDTYKRALERDMDDLYLRYLLGRLYYKLEMIDQALNEFKAIEDQVLSSVPLNYLIAKSLQKRDEYEKAYEALLNILKDKEFLEIGYLCSYCDNSQNQWQARCPRCGRWNTFSLNLEKQLKRMRAQPPSLIPSLE